MPFLPPVYMCDYCEEMKEAVWNGLPHWGPPEGWYETDDGTGSVYCTACKALGDSLQDT